jgi:hypothetical protein
MLAWPGVAHAGTWDASAVASHAMLYLDSPPGFREAMFREAAATGATSIRVDVPIPTVVRGPSGERSWSELEDVERLARKYDLDVVGLLYGTPWWMAQCPRHPAPGVQFYMCPPRNAKAFARLAAEIARRTRGTIDTWQILNEPNNRYVFAGDVRQYARVLIATSHAIRRVNPRARIVLGGLGGPKMQVWPARLLAIPGARDAFDIASVHLRGRMKVVVSAVAFWRRRLAELGFHGPIWATEHGYPTDPTYQWDKHYQGVLGQARYLSRSLPALIGAGIDRIFVTLRDNRGGPWATEGLIGGTVFDPPSPAPQVVRKPAADAVRRFAMSLLTRVRVAPSLASPPSLAQAPAGRVRAARGCYTPGAIIALAGSQFPPQGQVHLTFVASGPGSARTLAARQPVPIRSDGTFSASYRAPALASPAHQGERLTVLAGPAPGAAPFAGSTARLTLRLSARPCIR